MESFKIRFYAKLIWFDDITQIVWLTLKIFSCGRDVGDDVGDDAQHGGEGDQAYDQLKYHIEILGSVKMQNDLSSLMLVAL